MKKEKIPARFERVYSQRKGAYIEIWVDRETGVNYFYRTAGYSGGLTALLDQNGKPIVTPIKDAE